MENYKPTIHPHFGTYTDTRGWDDEQFRIVCMTCNRSMGTHYSNSYDINTGEPSNSGDSVKISFCDSFKGNKRLMKLDMTRRMFIQTDKIRSHEVEKKMYEDGTLEQAGTV